MHVHNVVHTLSVPDIALTLYTQCSPDTICLVAFKIYLEHNNDDNLNFVGMALDACLCGSKELQGVKKNALSECCWSHSALAQTQVTGTPCEKKLIFWSFLAKTKPDQNVTICAKFCSIA